MADRVTRRDVSARVAAYAGALAGLGLMPAHQAVEITWGAPYGQVLYVYRNPEHSHGLWHDVVGFQGSGGSGKITTRALHDALGQALRVLHEIPRDVVPFDGDVASFVRRSVEGRLGIGPRVGVTA